MYPKGRGTANYIARRLRRIVVTLWGRRPVL